jgi:uncharacterized protein
MVGRNEEIAILLQAIRSQKPELIAIYGRRRVGKTYMIRQVLQKEIVFEFSGTLNGAMKLQLANFSAQLTKSFGSPVPLAVPATWREALLNLERYLEPIVTQKQSVVFFDEFPWIHTRRSGFLQAFDYWWNSWASRHPKLTVIICGSAAAWMIEHVVNNKGGLHNRLTRTIRLMPFTLYESEAYLQTNGVKLPRHQIAQLYMCTGGVPHYLSGISPGQSITQAIDKMCFTKDGLLAREFENLYAALFENSSKHEEIVKSLALKPGGLSREEIINNCNLSTGGGATRLLNELAESGFISYQTVFEKTSNEGLYQLDDAFTHFYFRFLAERKLTGNDLWEKISKQPIYYGWAGYAFERMCQQHILQIKKALGIGGVATTQAAWRTTAKKTGTNGAQIDLVIDRSDQSINLCEIKFSQTPFTITKQYAAELLNKEQIFRMETNTKKALFTTLVTPFGVVNNEYKTGFVHSEILLDDLFI